MPLYRDEAVVLRTYPLGESDRIVVLLTAGRGKLRAVAKGVRRTASRFGGRLEPASHVKLLCYEGRELDVVNQAEVVEVHRALREDLGRMRDALAILEATDQVAQEQHPAPELFAMVVRALRALSERPAPLLVAGFYWKLLALDGAAPLLDACVRCGSGDDLAVLDLEEGGVLCRGCAPTAGYHGQLGGRRALTPEALSVVQRILGGDLGGALATPGGPLAAEVTDLATRALERHLERRLRVPRLLEGTVPPGS